MCDIDRYVDILYEPTLKSAKIPFVKTEWHRYAADMNRIPEDIDAATVEGSLILAGKNNRGFHWAITTTEIPLMSKPMTLKMHQMLVELIYQPFHQEIRNLVSVARQSGVDNIYHLDLHSMPSLGTPQHRDPGERRADIVVSDSKGLSSDPRFVNLVITEYVRAGFKVGYNWPYFGGRLTEEYGKPSAKHHTVQVELNRSLYMDEVTKKLRPEFVPNLQKKLNQAILNIAEKIPSLG